MSTRVPAIQLNDGRSVPAIGLGTYKTSDIAQIVEQAIDVGYRHFDCARVYHNEPEVGRALQSAISSGKVKREDLFFVTKVWPNSFWKGGPTASAHQSCKDLNTSYLDLLLIHWPIPFQRSDEDFPLDCNGEVLLDESIDYVEVWKEFEEIQRSGAAIVWPLLAIMCYLFSGLTKSIGVSNFNRTQMTRLCANSKIKPAVNQIECHPLLANTALIDCCQALGVKVVAYMPLARGQALNLDPIGQLADKYKVTRAQVVLRFLLQRGLIVIPKSSSKQRLEENINIFGFELTPQEVKELLLLDANRRFSDFKKFGSEKSRYYPFNEL